MIAARALRRWIWRADALLAAAAVYAWGHLFLGASEGPHPDIAVLDVVELAKGRDGVEESAVDWPAFLATLRSFSGSTQRPAATRPEPSDVLPDGVLPLRAYQLVCFILVPGEPGSFTLRSKDPANRDAFTIVPGRRERGIDVEGATADSSLVLVTLRRGEERCTYTMARGCGGGRRDSCFRAVPFSPASRPATAPGDPGPAAVALLDQIRVLPFYGEDGAPVGLRVTGVEGNSDWARLGLLRGDIIEEVEGHAAADPTEFRSRVLAQGGPRKMRVARTGEGGTVRLSLGS